MNSNLRTGDTVMVMAGADKGKTGVIIASDAKRGRVTIEGVNVVTKHTKPRSQKDRGGIKKEPASIDVSNVLIVCPSCGKTTRIGHTIDDKGDKHRTCKKCGAFMDGTKKARVKKDTTKATKATKEKDSKVEKAETKEKAATKKAAPKTTAAKSTKPATSSASKTASTTKRKAPVAKSQGK